MTQSKCMLCSCSSVYLSTVVCTVASTVGSHTCLSCDSQHLDLRETYADSFVDNGIDGLHLLELTTQELTSLGVQSALEQKTIVDLIDGIYVNCMACLVCR